MVVFDFRILNCLDAVLKLVQFNSHETAENFLAEINDTQ